MEGTSQLEHNRVRERVVLHVLPHPGGGGETYLGALSDIEGYRFERIHLAPSAKPYGHPGAILRRAFSAQRAARAYDVLHVHGEVASTICLPSVATRPSIVTLHGLNLLRRLGHPGKHAAKLNLRLIVRAASGTICVSDAEYADVVDAVGSRAARSVFVIRNGVELLAPPSPEERSAVREELGLADSTVVAISVGALDVPKDPLSVVRAAIETARGGVPFSLLLVGDGPFRPEVEQALREQGSEGVRILGFRSDVRRLLSAADLFVLSSGREGLPYSLLEAMSLGLPPVVSDVPGCIEAVADAGIAVQRGDVGGFAEAFRRLAADEQGRLALGERARDRVARHFRVEDMAERTRQVYDAVVDESLGRR